MRMRKIKLQQAPLICTRALLPATKNALRFSTDLCRQKAWLLYTMPEGREENLMCMAGRQERVGSSKGWIRSAP